MAKTSGLTRKPGLPAKPITSSYVPTETSVDLVLRNLPTKRERTQRKYDKEFLKDRWSVLSGRMMEWLHEGDRLEQLMAQSKLRDIGIMLGIATEKVLLLEGQPTQIISQPQHQAIDRLGVALKDALEKRGLVTLTERKIEITPNEPRSPQ